MEKTLTLAQTLLDTAKQAEVSDKERYEALGIAQRLIEPTSWLTTSRSATPAVDRDSESAPVSQQSVQ